MFTKLKQIKVPDSKNVHCLCLESVTSHGKKESVDATDAPKPNNTSNEGRAQHRRVLSEVNKEKYPSTVERVGVCAVTIFISLPLSIESESNLAYPSLFQELFLRLAPTFP